MLKLWLVLFFAVLSTGAFAQSQTVKVCDPSQEPCKLFTPSYPQIVSGNTAIPTYSASINFSFSSAGIAYCIYGSASKTVYIKGFRVTATASSQVVSNISVIKYSSLYTGGTPNAITVVPSDSTNPAATASAVYFTGVAATPGTAVGHVRDRFITISGSTIITVSEGLFQFSVYWDQPQILHGTSEGECIVTPSTAGGSWSIDAEWNEQ